MSRLSEEYIRQASLGHNEFLECEQGVKRFIAGVGDRSERRRRYLQRLQE